MRYTAGKIVLTLSRPELQAESKLQTSSGTFGIQLCWMRPCALATPREARLYMHFLRAKVVGSLIFGELFERVILLWQQRLASGLKVEPSGFAGLSHRSRAGVRMWRSLSHGLRNGLKSVGPRDLTTAPHARAWDSR